VPNKPGRNSLLRFYSPKYSCGASIEIQRVCNRILPPDGRNRDGARKTQQIAFSMVVAFGMVVLDVLVQRAQSFLTIRVLPPWAETRGPGVEGLELMRAAARRYSSPHFLEEIERYGDVILRLAILWIFGREERSNPAIGADVIVCQNAGVKELFFRP